LKRGSGQNQLGWRTSSLSVNIQENPEAFSEEEGGLKLVVRNVRSLIEERRKRERQATRAQKAADRITRFAGSMSFVYLHLLIFGFWIAINVGWLPLPKFDASFVVLGTSASVEAIFLSTFILISQNRMSVMQERRADLDLQISLLAEHEISKLIFLTSRIGTMLGIEEAKSDELRELQQDIRPESVLEKIEAETDQPEENPDSGRVSG
jgi:uncharacterized membrane protein